jgi:hypothetical protein
LLQLLRLSNRPKVAKIKSAMTFPAGQLNTAGDPSAAKAQTLASAVASLMAQNIQPIQPKIGRIRRSFFPLFLCIVCCCCCCVISRELE